MHSCAGWSGNGQTLPHINLGIQCFLGYWFLLHIYLLNNEELCGKCNFLIEYSLHEPGLWSSTMQFMRKDNKRWIKRYIFNIIKPMWLVFQFFSHIAAAKNLYVSSGIRLIEPRSLDSSTWNTEEEEGDLKMCGTALGATDEILNQWIWKKKKKTTTLKWHH